MHLLAIGACHATFNESRNLQEGRILETTHRQANRREGVSTAGETLWEER